MATMPWSDFQIYRCPSCGSADPDYDVHTDELMCANPVCRLRIAADLAKRMRDTPIWITKDMRCIAIADMETSHIQSCIGLIFKHIATGWRGQHMESLLNELKRRMDEEGRE